MTPIPIFLPSDSSSGVDIVYPKWIDAIACFGGLVAAVGLLWMFTALILSIITFNRIDVMEKPHIYSLVLTLFGIGILTVAVALKLITGQKVTE